jgi:hypothetical protein
MTYHHYNRLEAHWAENPNSKKLTAVQTLIALVIAQHINSGSNHYHLSAKTLSKYTNRSKSSVDRATTALEALGFFSVSRAGMRSPKDFRLLIECPKTCTASATDHYTETELAEHPQRWNKAQEPKSPELRNEGLDKNQLRQSDTEYRQTAGTEYGQSAGTEYGQSAGTNKELIKKNKEYINIGDFEILVISNALKELALSNEYTKDHELLQSALEGNRVEVLERAKEITGTATNPEPYLTQIVKTSPKSLLKRTSEQVHKAKYPRNLRPQYEAYREHTPELVSWNDLGTSQVSFLERATGDTLSITSATAASEASNKQVNLDSAKSLSEALELIAKPEQDLDLAVAALARSREFLKRHS